MVLRGRQVRSILGVELFSMWTVAALTRKRIHCKVVSVAINAYIQSWSHRMVDCIKDACLTVMLQDINTRCYPLEQLGHGTLRPSPFISYNWDKSSVSSNTRKS